MTAEDHAEIRQLYATYNLALDGGDAEGWADTFIEDGAFGDTEGHAALVGFAENFGEQQNGNARHWNSNNDLLFPSSARKRRVPFTSYKKPFRKIRETAKENRAMGSGEAGRPWVVYDFKDTLLTRLRGRFPYEVRQMIPNHQNQDVTARYEGDSDELARKMRDALEWWGNYCDELEDRKPKLQAVKGGKR